jgi:uncharacterized protein (TIGR02598 family)
MRRGFSLIEVLFVSALLGICAAGVTQTWSLCYSLNDQTRRMQAGKNIIEQEMERVRRLNWSNLSEQTSWTVRYYYDRYGKPVGSTSSVAMGFIAYTKVETMNSNALSLNQSATVDTSGGNSRSLRRVWLRVQPTGSSADAANPVAESVTFMTLGGP